MVTGDSWVKVPGNMAAERWLTRTGCRRVLVVVPHVTAGTRLVDLLPLLEVDHRVHVQFTVPWEPDAWHGVEAYVRALGGVILPWHQALRMEFDLALAASYREIHQISAPVLVSPHGVGAVKSRWSPRGNDAAEHAAEGLGRQELVYDGRVVPAAVLLTHEAELAVLQQSCPEAVSRAVVAGDPCLDRLRASMPLRAQYRQALGVQPDQKLVVVSSTWSPYSVFGSEPTLIGRLVAELASDEYRVVAALHPNIWSIYGARQVRAWLVEYLDAGHGLLPFEEGWRAALVAADVVIGDHGSVTHYAAALGVPVLMNAAAENDERPDSVTTLLRRLSACLDRTHALARQVRDVIDGHEPDRYTEVAQRMTSRPGQAAAIIRQTMYRLLGLPEPARSSPVTPVPMPTLLTRSGGQMRRSQ